MKLALIITTYNRPDLLKQCLDSLRQSDLSKVNHLVFVDDYSTDSHVLPLISSFGHKFKTVFASDTNRGIKQSLLTGYEIGFTNCDLCINLDPDAIVKPDWIDRLLELKQEHPAYIISGFNCNHPKNPIVGEGNGYVLRQHCNGINMLIDKHQYETIVKPALMRDGNWDYNSTNKLPFIITRPSVIQHIGASNSTMGHAQGDVACDFKLLSLPQVCLFGIDAHDPDGLKRAADICRRDVEFGVEVIITEHNWFRGREAYSQWMIKELWHQVKDNDCTHVLTIHEDGYIQDPRKWSDEFLEFDFIGAKWLYHDGMVCGNGGFSLRSKKFIEICSRLDIDQYHPEDSVLCRRYRPFLEKEFGIKYAPAEICDKFSIEAYGCHVMVDQDGIAANGYCGQFGFHGVHVKGLPIPLNPRQNTPIVRSANNGKYIRQRR